MKRILTMLAAGLTLAAGFALTAACSSKAAESAVPRSISAKTVRALQQHLLKKAPQQDTDGADYDLSGDKQWNAVDLSLMKQELLDAPQNDTLVVYFSRTGNTEKIASYLLDLTGADSFVIEAAVPYSDADIAYNNSGCRANQEQNDNSVRPEIAALPDSLDGYDTVFLGYPIWWGEEPRIIDTFLESYDFSEKTVIPFCTSASSGISVSEKNIAALVPIGTQLAGRRFAADASRDDVKTWYDTLPLTEEDSDMQLQITIGDAVLTASLEDNSSAQALADLLEQGSLALALHDYGSFEKVGALPQALPRNDTQISVDFGDLILYQGDQFSIYYDKNAWSFTKLGHIDNITQESLKAILGDGDVTAVLSLK